MKTNDINIIKLMEGVQAGKIQLPDFQRGWVWDDNRIKALIASITSSFPIGAVMFLAYGDPKVRFQHRMIEGAPDLKVEPEDLILDGQQRLTAIYAAMYSKNPVKTKNERGKEIDCYYYMDIEKALNPSIERLDAIISVPKEKFITSNFGKKVDLDLRTPENEYRQKLFPLNIIFSNSEIRQWQRGYDRFYANDTLAQDNYTKFDEEILAKLLQYQIPVIAMEKETPIEAICQVFENVNTGGVSLTVFELVTATFAMDNFNLRADWDMRQTQYFSREILNVIKSADFLMACTLLATYKSNKKVVSCKQKDVLNLSLEEYKNCAEILTTGFVELKNFLNEERIFVSGDIPYISQLTPMSVMFALLIEKNLIGISNIRNKIRQWYWCGVFGEMYGASSGSYGDDVIDFMNWIDDPSNLPEIVKNCNFNPMRLTTLQTRNSAAYKGFMALILKNSARDFIDGQTMDFVSYQSKKIDIHHIFPQSYCLRKVYPKSKWNSIINKTPLSYSTNRSIGGNAPSKYLKHIMNKNSDLKNCVTSHWIDFKNLSEDNFDEFIAARAGLLLDAVEKITGKKILGRDSDEVKNFFGRAI